MYNSPGVYIEDLNTGKGTEVTESNSVGAMIGIAPAGPVNTPVLVKSFTEYIEKFANGLDSPFMANSYLSYAVQGFFANGGSQLYVVRAIKSDAVVASLVTYAKIPCNIFATSEGTWGNNISISVSASINWSAANELFDVTVSLGDNKVTIPNVTVKNVVEKINSNSVANKWIKASNPNETLENPKFVSGTVHLTGGKDGGTIATGEYADLSNEQSFIFRLDSVIDKVAMVSIPGITELGAEVGLIKYCTNNNALPILDAPLNSTVTDVVTLRTATLAQTYANKNYEPPITNGALVYPWGIVNDPLTDTLKTVPACGHTMGVYARIIDSRGVFKAPAGIEAYVNGFVSMKKTLTSKDTDVLNPIGVVSIMPRVNQGIVIWGARGLNDDTTMRYVSDILLNLYIKKTLYARTQYAVFEPNTEDLWNKLDATCRDVLENLRLAGAFVGDKDTAYYVNINSINNTEATIEDGILNIEVGYAPTRPAEFVVIKLAHTIQN